MLQTPIIETMTQTDKNTDLTITEFDVGRTERKEINKLFQDRTLTALQVHLIELLFSRNQNIKKKKNSCILSNVFNYILIRSLFISKHNNLPQLTPATITKAEQ